MFLQSHSGWSISFFGWFCNFFAVEAVVFAPVLEFFLNALADNEVHVLVDRNIMLIKQRMQIAAQQQPVTQFVTAVPRNWLYVSGF